MKTDFLMIKPENLADVAKSCSFKNTLAGVEIYGSLGPWFYERFAAEFAAALASVPAGSTLVVQLDTPGGYVSGCFEACHDVQTAREAHPLVHVDVFSDGMVCSAGYALACALTSGAADKIIATPNALIGSIGVIASRVEENLPVSMPGFQIYYFATGADKIEGRLGTLLTDVEAAKIQADVDAIGASFFDLVAGARGMSAEQVRALNAATFRGQAAVDAGLVDAVYPSLAAYLNTPKKAESPMAMTPEEQAELTAAREAVAAANTERDKLVAESAARDARQLKSLLATRADLPEATRAILATMSLDAAQALADSIPVPVAPIAPIKVEQEAPAPIKVTDKPTDIVPPVKAVAENDLPKGADDKLTEEQVSALDRGFGTNVLTEAAKKRASYDPRSGNLTVR